MDKPLHFPICTVITLLTEHLKHIRNDHVLIFFVSICFSSLQALNWVFVVDTMNFCFWPEKESQQCEVTYKGTTYTGYMTLCAAITRAMDEGESMSMRSGKLLESTLLQG